MLGKIRNIAGGAVLKGNWKTIICVVVAIILSLALVSYFRKDSKEYFEDNNNIFRMDSFQNEIDKTLLKNYLFTANFAIRNKDREIAPYLAYAKIGDANTSLLDTIALSLSPKIKKSKYGRKFLNLLNSRKKYD